MVSEQRANHEYQGACARVRGRHMRQKIEADDFRVGVVDEQGEEDR